MQNWEYNYLVFKLESGRDVRDVIRLDALNQAGQQGWELVNVSPLGGNHLLYTFKRPAGVASAKPAPAARSADSASRSRTAKQPGNLRDIQVNPQGQSAQPQAQEGLNLQDILNSILGGNDGRL